MRIFLFYSKRKCFLSCLQLEILQRQVTNLADSQNTVDDRTTRTKTEHAVLQARYDMLEEQLRDVIIWAHLKINLNINLYTMPILVFVLVWAEGRRTDCWRAETTPWTFGPRRTWSHITEWKLSNKNSNYRVWSEELKRWGKKQKICLVYESPWLINCIH